MGKIGEREVRAILAEARAKRAAAEAERAEWRRRIVARLLKSKAGG